MRAIEIEASGEKITHFVYSTLIKFVLSATSCAFKQVTEMCSKVKSCQKRHRSRHLQKQTAKLKRIPNNTSMTRDCCRRQNIVQPGENPAVIEWLTAHEHEGTVYQRSLIQSEPLGVTSQVVCNRSGPK